MCTLCGQNIKQVKKFKMFKYLTYNQLLKLRLIAMQVLANCLQFLVEPNKKKVFEILLNGLNGSSQEQQKIIYQSLLSCKTKLSTIQLQMVSNKYS